MIERSDQIKDQLELRVKGGDVTIPGNRVAEIHSSVNIGLIKKKTTIFIQIDKVDLPDGLQYAGNSVILKLGTKNYFS